MPTLTHAESARINGSKSRGPITPEGKAKSSRNAVRHGMTLQSLLLTTENREAAACLIDEYTGQFQPVGPVEHEMVEMLAVKQWQNLRAENIQLGFFQNAAARAAAKIDAEFASADECSRAAETFRYMTTEDDSFRLFMRYANDIRRAYHTKLRELQSLQAKRQTIETTPVEEPAPETEPIQMVTRNEPKPAAQFPQTPRNAPCPCGSGAKYKRCCGPQAPPVLSEAA